MAGLATGLAALLAQPLAAQAQDRSWQVADGAWNIPGNWTGGVVPTIPNGAWINNSGTARVGAGITASADALHVGSTNGGGNTFSLEGGSFVSNVALAGESAGSLGTVSVSSGTWVNTSSILVGNSGTGNFLVSGGFVFTAAAQLGGASAGAGTITVSGGTFAVTNVLLLGSNGTGSLAISDGLVSSGTTIVAAAATSSGTITLSGSASSGGTLVTGQVMSGPGQAAFQSAGGTLRLTQNQSALFEGFEPGNVTINDGGFFLDTAGYNAGIATSMAGIGTFTKVGTGTLTLTGSHGYTGGTTVRDGTLLVDGGSVVPGGDLDISGSQGALMEVKDGSIGTGYTLRVGSQGTGSLSISGSNAQVSAATLLVGQAGTGTMTLSSGYVTSGVSSIGISSSQATAIVTGGTFATSGLLTIGFGGNGLLEISGGLVTSGSSRVSAMGAASTALVSGGTWDNASVLSVGRRGTGTLTISGTGHVKAGEVLVGETGQGTGILNLNGGVLATSKVMRGSGTAAFNWSGGTLRATGTSSALVSGFTSGIDIRSGGAVVDSNGYDVAITSAFTGSGAFTKIGAGALTLTGTSTYTGGTKIEAGTLIISDVGEGASVLGTGDVTVEENGKLAGIGNVLGDTFVAGTLAPGNSPGEMNFAGNLFLESTAVVQMELASATVYDQITVGGLLTYDGTLSITFLGGYIPTEGATFALFEAGSVAPGTQFDAIVFGDSGYAGTLDSTTGVLTVTAVPEPAATALFVLGGVALLARRRRVFPLSSSRHSRGTL